MKVTLQVSFNLPINLVLNFSSEKLEKYLCSLSAMEMSNTKLQIISNCFENADAFVRRVFNLSLSENLNKEIIENKTSETTECHRFRKKKFKRHLISVLRYKTTRAMFLERQTL